MSMENAVRKEKSEKSRIEKQYDAVSEELTKTKVARKHIKPLGKYENAKEYSRHIHRNDKRFHRLSGKPKSMMRRLTEREVESRLKKNAENVVFGNDSKSRQKQNLSDDVAKKVGRLAFDSTKKSIKSGKRLLNAPREIRLHAVYEKNDILKKKEALLREEKSHLKNSKTYDQNKKWLKQSKLSTEQKKRQKKRMVQSYKQKEGNAFTRTRKNAAIKIRKKKLQIENAKRTAKLASTILGTTGLIIMVVLLILSLVIYLAIMSFEGASTMVSMNDYGTMSEGTDYLTDKETELDAYINQDRTRFESGVEMSEGKDIDEFVYNICSFGYDQMKLIAYLSAKYGSFTIDSVKGELDSIFDEMYHLKIECKSKTKNRPDGTTYEYVTCYVTVTKKDLETIIEERLTDSGLKTAYEGYMLTGNGQQVFGPVIKEDWTNKISSPFGTRLHPIQKTVKHHNGVDIAVPIGTKLFSAVDGVVIAAKNSGNAGNMVTVQKDDGWKVTFMHMDSIAVSAGQKVSRGQFVGCSGNTGGSTGPHLHLQVENADGNYINPIYIIPQKQFGL